MQTDNESRIERSPAPLIAVAQDYTKGDRAPWHAHRRGQLMFVIGGTMRVSTGQGTWSTPTGRACWMPPQARHRASYPEAARLRAVYVRADLCGALPTQPCVLNLTALLRELVLATLALGERYAKGSSAERLAMVLIDQIAEQPPAPLFLPEGRDRRLRRITRALQLDPSDARSLKAWAQAAGTSDRTLERLFDAETGMKFVVWRQQLRLNRAVEMLAAGRPVTQVAYDLGYASPASFTGMFTTAMGRSPRTYRLRQGEEAMPG